MTAAVFFLLLALLNRNISMDTNQAAIRFCRLTMATSTSIVNNCITQWPADQPLINQEGTGVDGCPWQLATAVAVCFDDFLLD